MGNEQDLLLKMARQLGNFESQTFKAENKVQALRKRADDLREAIFANLAATGTPEERQQALVRLLSQASQRPRLQGRKRGDKGFRPIV